LTKKNVSQKTIPLWHNVLDWVF